MTITYCDITKKPVPGTTTAYSWEIRDNRYDTIQDKDLSIDGMTQLEDEVQKRMGERTIYSFMERKKVLEDTLKEMTQ
jgi:hypothetical protein